MLPLEHFYASSDVKKRERGTGKNSVVPEERISFFRGVYRGKK